MRRFGYIVLLFFYALTVKAQTYHVGDVITNDDDGSQGVVFYVNPERTGGWMVALNDLSSGSTVKFKWGKKNADIVSLPNISPSENIYYLVQTQNTMPGNIQTQFIRNAQTDHTVAVWMVDFAHGWYLPSARELQYLYSSLAVVDSALYKAGGACMSDDVYWSSTEKDKDNAWAIPFMKTITNGSQSDAGYYGGGGFWFHGKDQTHRVRAIRNFTMSPSPSGFSYLWNTGETTPDITVSPSQSTAYSVTVSMGEGCETTAQIMVSVPAPPGVEIITSTGSDTICEGDEITLHAELKRPAIGDILCQDGSLVKLEDWPVEGKTAKGVVFYVDPSGQHGWAVSVTESQKAWCSKTNVDIPGLQNYTNWIPAISDFTGYENTQMIHNAADANTSYPAVDYVMGLGSIGGYSWYLPAMGQLNVLFGSILAVNQSLGQVGSAISYSTTAKIWSSTESSMDKAMIIKCDNGTVDSNLKSASINVRAVIDF